jgi:hypothetical protein
VYPLPRRWSGCHTARGECWTWIPGRDSLDSRSFLSSCGVHPVTKSDVVSSGLSIVVPQQGNVRQLPVAYVDVITNGG